MTERVMDSTGIQVMPSLTTTESPQRDTLKVGILEVQGAFNEHHVALCKAQKRLGDTCSIEIVGVRHPDHIVDTLDGLIIPGGESTTISLFLKRNKMDEPLRQWIDSKRHVTWGTCAGMILLSKQTENQKIGGQPSLAEMDTDVSRNFFGRQINSFESQVMLKEKLLGPESPDDKQETDSYHGVFIRAPAVVECSPEVTVLATLRRPENDQKDVIVAVQQGNMIATAFHPELTDDLRWHIHFIKMIQKVKQSL